jgi:hypothetical protein
VPAEIEGFAGVTAIDSKVGAATVSTVDPVTVPDVAVIVVVPWCALLARPAELTLATPVFDELQETELVRF